MLNKSRSRQKGLAVIDIMLWMVIFSIGLTVRAAIDSRQATQTRAINLAGQVREINASLQELLSTQPTFPDGVYVDLDFLRSVDCDVPGTAAQHYLPCQFQLGTMSIGRFFQNITITSTPSAVPGVAVKISTSVFGPFVDRAGVPDPAIAGTVASAASGYTISASSPIVASVRSLYDVDINTAEVIAINTANPVTDQWVRIDGANFMNNHFTFSLDANGLPISGVQNAAFVQAQNFIDWDDPNFNVDPSGTSNLNELKVNGDIEIVGDGSIYNAGVDEDLRLQARGGGDIELLTDGAIQLTPGLDPTDLVYINGTGFISIADAVMRLNGDINLTNLLPKIAMQSMWIIEGLNNYVEAPACVIGGNPLVIAHNGRVNTIVHNPIQAGAGREIMAYSTTRAEPVFNGADLTGWFILSADTHPEGSGAQLDSQLVVTTYCDYSNYFANLTP